jgi:hypothetical protein
MKGEPGMETQPIHPHRLFELPDLTKDDVIAIVLVPILFSVLSFSLSLSRGFLYLVLIAWQSAAVGFLLAYILALRTPLVSHYGWPRLVNFSSILVGLAYSPFLYIWLYVDLGLSFILSAFLALLGGQAGWLLFYIFKPLVVKVKWRTALSVLAVLITAGLLWIGGRGTADGQTAQIETPPTLPPIVEDSGHIIESDLAPVLVNTNMICEPDNPIKPTLVIVNFGDSPLSFELDPDTVMAPKTVRSLQSESARIPEGEYFYMATYPIEVLPAVGQVELQPGCRAELTFWIGE